jgi:5-formyltetrahydrofolate cyclo-ligase
MSSRRASLSKAESVKRSQLIQAKALQLPSYITASSVALYSPVQNEAGTGDILQHALSNGRKVYYPRLAADSFIGFFQILSAAELMPGRFGILEPTGSTAFSDDESLIVFVPGIAFDVRGNRLGRGKGWYDRILTRFGVKAVSVGLGYECQIVDEVPTERWDRKVDYVITEARVIDCATRAHSSQNFLEISTRKGVL